MSNLTKFLAQPVEVEISGEKYKLKPLTVNDLPAITKSRSKNPTESAEGAQELAFSAFKQICPEVTREQFGDVDMKILDELMTAVAKVNGHDIEEAKKKLLNDAKSN